MVGMADKAPLALVDDTVSRRWFTDLNKYARRAKTRQTRLNNLRLIHPRIFRNGEAYAEHALAWNDPPDLELLFERRDRYRQLYVTSLAARTRVESEAQMTPTQLESCLASIASMERAALQHLQAMEEHLGESRKLELKHMEMVGKLLTEGAKLMQNERREGRDDGSPDARELARLARSVDALPEDRFDEQLPDA